MKTHVSIARTIAVFRMTCWFIFVLLLSAASWAAPIVTTGPIDVDAVMRVAARKYAAFDATQKEKTAYPNDAKGAVWRTVDADDWISGFYPGALWYLYEYAHKKNWPDAPAWKQRAEAWTKGLENQQFNKNDHDIGFRVFNSFGNGYRLTGNPDYLPVINQAARSLADRFRPETGMIRSQGKIDDMDEYLVIIDNMMNLELLIWSARHGGTTRNGGSEDLLKIAKSHADRTADLFLRPDGSTYHVVDLDAKNGAVVYKGTRQGKADESTWSRGQTWTIYGFAYMYEATGDRRYLEAALKAANRYLAWLPADWVPPSDFNSDLTSLEFKDSSAAAIAASALLRLSGLLEKPELKQKILDAAKASLKAITSAPYFAPGDDKAGLVFYSARNYVTDANHPFTNTSLIWSDYYLLEALLRYENIQDPASSR